MTRQEPDQPISSAPVDVTLDIRSLRSRVEFDDGVPSLLMTDGTVSVRIGTGVAGPSVRDLIPVGRLVAAALRFQAACNRFTRAQRRAPAAASPDAPHEEER
jgi:hypothetical protein